MEVVLVVMLNKIHRLMEVVLVVMLSTYSIGGNGSSTSSNVELDSILVMEVPLVVMLSKIA